MYDVADVWETGVEVAAELTTRVSDFLIVTGSDMQYTFNVKSLSDEPFDRCRSVADKAAKDEGHEYSQLAFCSMKVGAGARLRAKHHPRRR